MRGAKLYGFSFRAVQLEEDLIRGGSGFELDNLRLPVQHLNQYATDAQDDGGISHTLATYQHIFDGRRVRVYQV